jgi:metallo-beta-lactamase family protein
LSAFLPEQRITCPHLDAAFRLTPEGPVDISKAVQPPRIDPVRVGNRDWHNDFQSLVLDLQDKLAKTADDKARGVVIRKLRRALTE